MSGGDEAPPGDQWQVLWTAQRQTGNHSRSNDAPPISTLPQELFVQIIEEADPPSRVDSWKYGPRHVHCNWTSPYQLVCRHWRDIICSTPGLWQEINVSRNPEWLEVCLTRCSGTPAKVYVLNAHSSSATFATLRQYASSIKACYVYSDHEMTSLSGLPTLLATPMPALETLSLIAPYPLNGFTDVPITHNLLPRLTTLSLEDWSEAPRDTALYASLRSLTLYGTPWPFSYDNFLDVMEKCSDLEHLDLDSTILDGFSTLIATPAMCRPPRTTRMILPRLQVMNLSGPREVVFHLLATIHAPQATRIESAIHLDGADDEPGPHAAHLLAPILPLGYPFLRSPTSISIRCRDGTLWLRLRSEAGSLRCRIEDRGRLLGPFNHRWPAAYLGHNLAAIMDVFPLASVDTLEIDGRLDQAAADTWQRVFQAFSKLRTLHLKGGGSLDSLWLGLWHATELSWERDGVVCCPFLSEIAIDDRSWVASNFRFAATTALFGIVRGALRARADAGGARLQKLQLYLQYTQELWSQTSELRDAFVEDVRALVGELDYHDWKT